MHAYTLCFVLIKKAFAAELGQLTGRNIDAPTSGADEPTSKPTGNATAEPAAAAVIETVEMQKSMKHQADKLGFKVDAYVVEAKATTLQIWKICEINDTQTIVRLEQNALLKEARTVGTKVLLESWKLHKGKMTKELPGWPEKLVNSVSIHPDLSFDILKGKILEAYCFSSMHIYTQPLQTEAIRL